MYKFKKATKIGGDTYVRTCTYGCTHVNVVAHISQMGCVTSIHSHFPSTTEGVS